MCVFFYQAARRGFLQLIYKFCNYSTGTDLLKPGSASLLTYLHAYERMEVGRAAVKSISSLSRKEVYIM